jgi:hypothetical protein
MLIANEKRAGERAEKPDGNGRPARVAALREPPAAERRGNAAPWKAWKTQKAKASFPLFPPGLEIRPKTKAPDFSHFHRADGGSSSPRKDKNETATRFHLTDRGPFKHHKNASVASLRS